MARFLVDESLPRSVTQKLGEAGHDVTDVRDVGLRGAADAAVAARAKEESRILVSADLDFANAVRFPPGTHPGIVVVRLPDEWPPRDRAERTRAAIDEAGVEHLEGAITIVEPTRTRTFGANVPRE